MGNCISFDDSRTASPAAGLEPSESVEPPGPESVDVVTAEEATRMDSTDSYATRAASAPSTERLPAAAPEAATAATAGTTQPSSTRERRHSTATTNPVLPAEIPHQTSGRWNVFRGSTLWRRFKLNRQASTPMSKCTVCNRNFDANVTQVEAERHTFACLLVSQLKDDPEGLDTLNAVVERYPSVFGFESDGAVRFPEVSRHHAHTVASSPVARTCLHILQATASNGGGGGESITNQRYLIFSQMPDNQFAALKRLTFPQKKRWFYSQLSCFRVNYVSSWVIVDVERGSDFLLHSFNEIRSLGPHDLHKELQCRFKGEAFSGAGGLSREWLTLVVNEIFDPINGLFIFSDIDNLTYQVNALSGINEMHLDYFKFTGRIIGKAIFDHVVVNAPLALPLLKQLLCWETELEDLGLLDSQLYNSLTWMLNNPIDGTLFETFSVEVEAFGETRIDDLKEDGSEISVTDSNKHLYVALRSNYRLYKSISEQIEALKAGLLEVIPLSLLRVFDFNELELLINGQPHLDVDDWEKNTEYMGSYHECHPVIRWFWSVLKTELSQEQQCRLLQFCTGTSRVPATGFADLETNRGECSKFTIQSIAYSSSFPYLRAHTCFHRLTLPEFPSRDAVRESILAAVEMDVVGFGMDD